MIWGSNYGGVVYDFAKDVNEIRSFETEIIKNWSRDVVETDIGLETLTSLDFAKR